MSLYAFLHITKPSLAFSFTVWLPPTGSRRACTETVHVLERETGLEPATACLEGRNSTTELLPLVHRDRKSTRLNSSHLVISYAVFCLKKKKKKKQTNLIV